jgi:succinyl-CoA synthetase beta subunit
MVEEQREFLKEPEAIQLLGPCGIGYPSNAFAASAAEATEMAANLDFPVVLKAVSSSLVHKSRAGGVLCNLENKRDVGEAFAKHNPPISLDGVLVVRQVPEGLDLIIGGKTDPSFGQVLVLGLGGTLVEAVKDVSIRLIPVAMRDVEAMIDETRAGRLIEEHGLGKRLDREALAHLVLRVSDFMSQHPEIVELDLNPVRLYHRGLSTLDVRVATLVRHECS